MLLIERAILPIGDMSKEAQEVLKKEFKNYREGSSRKCSRQENLEYVLKWLLISSDPHISGMRKVKKRNSFFSDALSLIVPPEILPRAQDIGSSSDS